MGLSNRHDLFADTVRNGCRRTGSARQYDLFFMGKMAVFVKPLKNDVVPDKLLSASQNL